MQCPTQSWHSSHGEDGREQVKVQTKAVVGRRRVEVDVGVDALGTDRLKHDVFDLLAHAEQTFVARVGGDLLGKGLEVCRPWVVHLVDPVAEAHDAVLGGETGLDEWLDVFFTRNFVEHLHHRFVGTAMQWPLEGAHRGRGGGVQIGERGDGGHRCKGRSIKTMFSVQNQTDVKATLHRFRRASPLRMLKKLPATVLEGSGAISSSPLRCRSKLAIKEGVRAVKRGLSQVGLGEPSSHSASKWAWADTKVRRACIGEVSAGNALSMSIRPSGMVMRPGVPCERGQLVSIGETLVPQEEAALFKGGVPGQAVNVDADVFQDPLFTINEAHHTVGHHHVGKTFVDEGTGERFGSSAHKGVRR